MDVIDISKVPGQIEPSEQNALSDLAASIVLNAEDSIVEFGAFFGRSTACLVNGLLRRNLPPRNTPFIYAFDSFSLPSSSPFCRLVKDAVASGGVENFLRSTPNTLNWRGVFDHFLGEAQSSGILKATEGDIASAKNDLKSIALMHVDAPKDYEGFKPILFNFFPSLRQGAVVIFQDYFFPFSGTLIAAVQMLIEAGIVERKSAAATSLAVRVLKPIDAASIRQVDAMLASASVAAAIDRALSGAQSIDMTDKERYFARLTLAKMQYLWSQKTYKGTADSFGELTINNKMDPRVLREFLTMLSVNFDSNASVF